MRVENPTWSSIVSSPSLAKASPAEVNISPTLLELLIGMVGSGTRGEGEKSLPE